MFNRVEIISSNLAAGGYDPRTSELAIEFKTGRCYVYADVPDAMWNELRSASSAGSYFNKNIRGGGFAFTESDASVWYAAPPDEDALRPSAARNPSAKARAWAW